MRRRTTKSDQRRHRMDLHVHDAEVLCDIDLVAGIAKAVDWKDLLGSLVALRR